MLLESDHVYRLVLIDERDKRNKNIPAERCFAPKPNDNGKLSVDAEQLTTPEETLSRWGSSFNAKGEYKPYKKWEIYSLNIATIKLMDKTISVYHDPIVVIPKEKGKPDNPAHALVDLSKVEEADVAEVILKLRNHAVDRRIDVNMGEVDTLVEKYRAQWD